MQIRISLVLTILIFMVIGCGQTDPLSDLQSVTSTAGKYRLLMPGSPKSVTESMGDSTLHIQLYEEKDGTFIIACGDTTIPDNESEAKTQGRLDDGRNDALTSARGTLISESQIKLADRYPGREFRGDLPDINGIMVTRIYLVGKRMYQVSAVGKQSWVDRAEIRKCIDSFELLP